MKIKDLLLESFKDAVDKFSNDAPSDEVQAYLDKFRQLSTKNIIKGPDKDIGKWTKGDWNTFKTMIDTKAEEVSRMDIKKKKVNKTDERIIVYADNEKTVVIPLTERASCHFGKDTKWCTSVVSDDNEFNNYFSDGKTLVYALLSNGDKIAAAVDPSGDVEYFDNLDKSITSDMYTSATGIEEQQLIDWADEYASATEPARMRAALSTAESAYNYAQNALDGQPFPEGEDIIATDATTAFKYARNILVGAFPKGEDAISTDADFSYNYANDVLDGRPFPKGEDAIATNPEHSYYYARYALRGPFPKGEDIIATKVRYALDYAIHVIEGPFPKGEDIIASEHARAFDYIKMLNSNGFEQEAREFEKRYD